MSSRLFSDTLSASPAIFAASSMAARATSSSYTRSFLVDGVVWAVPSRDRSLAETSFLEDVVFVEAMARPLAIAMP